MEQKVQKPTKKIVVPQTEVSEKLDSTTRNYLIIMGLVSAGIVVFGGYMIYRLTTQYIYQSNVNKAQDQLIASLITKQKNLQALKPNFEAINSKGANGISDAQLILRAVPTTQDYENLLATLEKIGQDSGVKVTNVSQSSSSTSGSDATNDTAVSGATATGFPFTVNVEGSYSAILEFLKKTENSARVINFNSMSLNGDTGKISANLTMTTFYKPDANINSTMVPLK